MAELLLELYSEEIPPQLQIAARTQLKLFIENSFKEDNINYKDLLVYSSPTRLTLHVTDLSKKIKIESKEIKGPKVGSPDHILKGFIKANKIAVVASGHTSVLAQTAGIKLPLQSRPLQALVSEPIKPVINTVVMSNAVHGYVSQSDKGDLVIGAGIDGYNSYAQRGSAKIVEHCAAAILELFQIF